MCCSRDKVQRWASRRKQPARAQPRRDLTLQKVLCLEAQGAHQRMGSWGRRGDGHAGRAPRRSLSCGREGAARKGI